MEDKARNEFLIRGVIILFGISMIVFGVYSLYEQFSLAFSNFSFEEFNVEVFEGIIFLDFLLFSLFGYIIYFIGRHWKDSLKYLTKTLISIGSFFLILSIIFFSINSNSENLVNSIQPSIDLLIVNSIDQVIEDQIEIKNGETLKLILASNVEIKKLHNKNLTYDDSLYLKSVSEIIFGEGTLTNEQQIQFSKIIISQVYDNLSKKDPKLLEVGIPISMLSEVTRQQNQNLESLLNSNIDSLGLSEEEKLMIELLGTELIIESIKDNPDLFLSMFTPSEEAYINLLISENEVTKDIQIGNVNDEDINLIWQNLGLTKNSSLKNKQKILDILFSVIITEFEKQSIIDIAIPVASIGSLIPDEIRAILDYDIFGDNLENKKNALKDIRNNCNNNQIEYDEICQAIMITEYETFLKNIDNLTKQSQEMGQEIYIPEFNASKYDSLTKLENIINEKTKSWATYLLIFIVFMVLSILSYLGHFKLFNRELITMHVPYYISKQNFIRFLPTFVIIFILYFLIASGFIIEKIAEILPEEFSEGVLMITNIEIYKTLITIFDSIIFLYVIYLIISIILFATFFILLKKEVEKIGE